MDIEQLKLIIDMLSNAGEGVFWIAVFWIAKGYFIGFAVSTTILVALFLILRTINKVCSDSARKAVEQISGNRFSEYTEDYVMKNFWDNVKKFNESPPAK